MSQPWQLMAILGMTHCMRLVMLLTGLSSFKLNASSQELNASVYQGILVGLEMCLQHAGFRHVSTDENFQNICAVYVDETHCIGQWGGKFWPAYSELNKL